MIAPSQTLALVDTDALIGELARRGRLVLSGNVPAGIALEDIERARRALPLEDRLDALPSEPADLDLPTPGAVQGWLDGWPAPSWTGLLTRAFAAVVWGQDRRAALVELAALCVRWIEALDARGGGR